MPAAMLTSIHDKAAAAGWQANRRTHSRMALVAGLALLATVQTANAGDWPQIMGPNRNGIAVGEKLADSFPAGGPKPAWEAKVGSGFAGVAVSGETLVLFHRLQDEDTLTAFHAVTGKQLWSQGFATRFQASIVTDDGPRAVPTIEKGRVYALAPNGGLYCVELNSGKVVWQRQTHEMFRVPDSYFGAGTSPLVEGKVLIVNVGGNRDGAGMVAFNLETGEVAWKSTDEQASYSSPIAVTLDGTRHLFCVTRLNFVSLDPTTGSERFHIPFGKRGPTVNAAIPIVFKNQVLLTASYGIGAELVTIRGERADIDWSDELLSSQYTTPILHEGTVYGIDGRQDGGPITLKCFDPVTRKVHWTQAGLGYATLIGADGKLLIMQTNGQLRLAELTPVSYRELGSTKLLTGECRALPALSGGRLYVRNESTLKCFPLEK